MNAQKKHQLKSYFSYRKQAVGRHSVHSPFVYEFIDSVLRKVKSLPDFEEIEFKRKNFKGDNTAIKNIDFGAGSVVGNKEVKLVAEIADTALLSKKYARLLAKICQFYEHSSVLELGTSLGVTTQYLAQFSEVTTIEGNPHLSKYVEPTFEKYTNINQRVGEFDTVLPELLDEGKTYDLILIDGNHTYEATKRYFEKLLPHLSSKGMLIFDDIYWSEGMTAAWCEIIADNRLPLTMDLYKFGIVVPGITMEKQHFVLKY